MDALRINLQCGASVAALAAAPSAAIRVTDGSSIFVDFAARLAGRTQRSHLTPVAEVSEQISEASRPQVLLEKAAAEVMNDLGGAVEAGRLVEMPDRIQEDELDAGHLGEAGVGLQLAEPDLPVRPRECVGRLVDELDALPAGDDGPHLLARPFAPRQRKSICSPGAPRIGSRISVWAILLVFVREFGAGDPT